MGKIWQWRSGLNVPMMQTWPNSNGFLQNAKKRKSHSHAINYKLKNPEAREINASKKLRSKEKEKKRLVKGMKMNLMMIYKGCSFSKSNLKFPRNFNYPVNSKL